MKDFSQHGEQEHILEFFKGRTGRFLDIGAFDGVTGSNTRALAEIGWTGVCIEASPNNFAKLIRNRLPGIECVNAAVMGQPGVCLFSEAGQLATCLTSNLPDKFRLDQYYVGAITPAMLADKFGDHFDFISLDVEGCDLEVLGDLGPVADHASLLCIEDSMPFHVFDEGYYSQLRVAAATLGFLKEIARTPDSRGTGNTLLEKTA